MPCPPRGKQGQEKPWIAPHHQHDGYKEDQEPNPLQVQKAHKPGLGTKPRQLQKEPYNCSPKKQNQMLLKIKIFTMYNMITVKDIRVFVNTLDKFLEYLGDNFEIIQKDVSMIKSVTDLLKTTNPQLMMTQFHQYVSVYSDEIHECNDAFLD